jgi:hydrogenase 3 maturation protease
MEEEYRAGVRSRVHRRLYEVLRGQLLGRVSVLGVGNRLRGDDGAGSIVARRLASAMEHAGSDSIFDGGLAPENWLERVVGSNPDTVLLIDAVAMGEAPGTMRVVDGSKVEGGFGTHRLPLELAVRYLASRGIDRVVFVGIEPRTSRVGEGLSSEVSQAVGDLEMILRDLLGETVPPGSVRSGRPIGNGIDGERRKG